MKVNVEGLIMDEMSIIVDECKGLSTDIKDNFNEFYFEAKKIVEESKVIIVTSLDQKRDMADAREKRLRLKNIRVNVEKQRKNLKEDSIRTGKAIDGIANVLKHLIVPAENYLQLQEDFSKIFEEKRKNDLKEKREKEISQFGDPSSITNLSDFDEAGYQNLLKIFKLEHSEVMRKKQLEEAEELRKREHDAEIAKKEEENRSKLFAENERLRVENEQIKKKEKEAREYREKEQAKEAEVLNAIKKEKDAAEKALKEKKDKEDLQKRLDEERAKDEEIKRLRQERTDRLASDRDKLIKLNCEIILFSEKLKNNYELKNHENQSLVHEVINSLRVKSDLINSRIESFGG